MADARELIGRLDDLLDLGRLDDLLDPGAFEDIGPDGLQVPLLRDAPRIGSSRFSSC